MYSLDHLVIISADLGTAMHGATEAGFTVVPGGTHAAGTTHNALVGFGDGTYLELISPTMNPPAGEHRWFERARHGGGLVDVCLTGEPLDEAVTRMRAGGVRYTDPFEKVRERPDGTRVVWRLALPEGTVGESGWPFLIEDTTPRDLRVPSTSSEMTHRNGARAVAGVTVVVRDLARSSEEYRVILGVDGTTTGDTTLFRLGNQWILLREATDEALRRHVDDHGQGPVRITLGRRLGWTDPLRGTPIDPGLVGGADIELV